MNIIEKFQRYFLRLEDLSFYNRLCLATLFFRNFIDFPIVYWKHKLFAGKLKSRDFNAYFHF